LVLRDPSFKKTEKWVATAKTTVAGIREKKTRWHRTYKKKNIRNEETRAARESVEEGKEGRTTVRYPITPLWGGEQITVILITKKTLILEGPETLASAREERITTTPY